MLTTDDKKEIRKIVKEEVRIEAEVRTDPLRGSLVMIEKKIDSLKDILSILKGRSAKIEDHEDRMRSLESASKF